MPGFWQNQTPLTGGSRFFPSESPADMSMAPISSQLLWPRLLQSVAAGVQEKEIKIQVVRERERESWGGRGSERTCAHSFSSSWEMVKFCNLQESHCWVDLILSMGFLSLTLYCVQNYFVGPDCWDHLQKFRDFKDTVGLPGFLAPISSSVTGVPSSGTPFGACPCV